jgi:Amt family ammonium transporter
VAVQAFATTIIASASAMLTWIFFDAARGKKISAMGACIGSVVGLVAITPAAGFVSMPHSLFIGFAAALISNLAVRAKNKSNLDDTLDVFPLSWGRGYSRYVAYGCFCFGCGANLWFIYYIFISYFGVALL